MDLGEIRTCAGRYDMIDIASERRVVAPAIVPTSRLTDADSRRRRPVAAPPSGLTCSAASRGAVAADDERDPRENRAGLGVQDGKDSTPTRRWSRVGHDRWLRGTKAC